MTKEEKQNYIIDKLNDIFDIAEELMKIAEIGEDGNLKEMAYHIKCYSRKIIIHLLKEWKNNIKFAIRKEEKYKLRIAEKEKEKQQINIINQQIFQKFIK